MPRLIVRNVLQQALILAVGIALGMWLGRRDVLVGRDALGFAEAVGRGFFLSQRADLQYCEASPEASKEALLDWLVYLDAQPIGGQSRDPLMTARGLAIDKTIALGRLALLEERSGTREDAEDYWRRAGSHAIAAAWTDTTPSGIRSAVVRLDPCRR